MTEHVDALKSLHTSLIDSRNGYEEALEDSEGKGLAPLFRKMVELHDRHATELAERLSALGEEADEDGSFMSTVHRTVISIRSILTGLDESILPGLIDGEERNLRAYDEAIDSAWRTSAPRCSGKSRE
jgi:uncharacterized protein (TIGR02284 family)